MVRWIKLTQHQSFGLFALGLLLFALQELPYMIMPLVPMETNVLTAMQDKSPMLNGLEKVLGIGCIVVMLFVVRNDTPWFSLRTSKEILFFCVAAAALLAYYIGWVFYFRGNQSLGIILGLLVAMPPLYYTFIGLWRGNTLLAVLGGAFLATHLCNVWTNLK